MFPASVLSSLRYEAHPAGPHIAIYCRQVILPAMAAARSTRWASQVGLCEPGRSGGTHLGSDASWIGGMPPGGIIAPTLCDIATPISAGPTTCAAASANGSDAGRAGADRVRATRRKLSEFSRPDAALTDSECGRRPESLIVR